MHLIFAIKYRKKLLIRYDAEIKQLFYDISKEKDFEIIEMKIDKDHIHVLIRYSPTKSVVDIVKLLKQISTYRIWRQNSNDINLKNTSGKNKFFSQMDILLVV